MLYAKVVLGLPVDVAFDYSVPPGLERNLAVGARVWVNFRNKKSVGYVVGLAKKTSVKRVKDILALIDEIPILSGSALLLSRRLADYYFSSQGEVIETMLPQEIRKGKPVKPLGDALPVRQAGAARVLLHDLDPRGRWEVYLDEIKQARATGKSAVILFSDIQTVIKARQILEKAQVKDTFLLYRREKEELALWQDIRSKASCVVLGTRSAVFAPVNNLGLIIIDREEDQVYKQEQAPHYHCRQAALIRSNIEGAKIILESQSPSLESFYLSQKGALSYQFIKRSGGFPQVKIIDTRRVPYAERKGRAIFSRSLTDNMLQVLNEKGKALVFINRRGFATYAACHNCLAALKCPACNISLVYHFSEDLLKCHHCSFKMVPPKICPYCNAGYIKYSGLGTDKIESELARIFPQAKIGEDIVVSTSLILKDESRKFDLICVMGADNLLNRPDFMAAEKFFYLLSGLCALTDKTVIIPTNFPGHHSLKSVASKDPGIFYSQELKFRKQLKFPPYRNFALVKVRGRDAEKAKKAAEDLFSRLKDGKEVKAVSLNPADPEKLRGNFYWQVLLSASSVLKLNKFLKIHLKNLRYSGIIVTIDVDPV